MQREFMFTSESVTDGHPDKLCDQVSDRIVSRFLARDPLSQVTAECAVSTGILFLAVKYRSDATVDVTGTAREVIRTVGYREKSFNAANCTVMTSLNELADGRNPAVLEDDLDDRAIDELTAQDQATVFGFACNHTPAKMPLPIWLAHRLAKRLSDVRKSGALAFLAPDGKTQVGVEFKDLQPDRIHSVTLVASQRDAAEPSPATLREGVIEQVLRPVFDDEAVRPDAQTRIAVNPETPTYLGGPTVHAGLTGRKNAVDTYGEFARHSGAALSGKDPSRVDRSGAYMARYAAKNVVAAGLADLCEVQLSYSMGLAAPVSVQVETYGTARVPEERIARRLREVFDFRVAAITRQLRLREVLARGHELAAFGQVGRTDLPLPWEATDRAEALR